MGNKQTKQCSRCKSRKPLRAFGICRTNNDGLQYACKDCHKAQKLNKAKENKRKWSSRDPYKGGK